MSCDYFFKISAIGLALFYLSEPVCGQVFSRGRSTLNNASDVIERMQQFPSDGGLLLQLRNHLRNEREPEIIQQGLAILATGYLLRQEVEVGVRFMSALQERYPDSNYSRAVAVENLGGPCSACSGEGRFSRPCSVCEGDGRCGMCDGSGRYQMRMMEGQSSTCPRCHGDGRCDSCEGSGRSHRTCHACRGRGVILDRQMIQRAYRFAINGEPEEFIRRVEISRGQGDGEEELRDEDDEDDDALRFF